jgi:hypothetical protein
MDGKKLGTTPFTYNETTTQAGKVELVAKQAGKERKFSVDRNQVDVMPIVAGAGIGVGACLALNAVGFVAGFLCPFALGLNVAGCLALPGGPVLGWYAFGNHMPDTVAVKMDEPPVPAATSDGKSAGGSAGKPSISY